MGSNGGVPYRRVTTATIPEQLRCSIEITCLLSIFLKAPGRQTVRPRPLRSHSTNICWTMRFDCTADSTQRRRRSTIVFPKSTFRRFISIGMCCLTYLLLFAQPNKEFLLLSFCCWLKIQTIIIIL